MTEETRRQGVLRAARNAALLAAVALLTGCGGASDGVATTPAADTTAPTFAGAISATPNSTAGTIQVAWNAAGDNVSPASAIVYRVYRATVSGAQGFTTPLATTAAGSASFTDNPLSKITRYYYVVRAVDEAGNADANVIEKSAIANATPADTTPPTFAGASSAAAQSLFSVAVSWIAASDTVSPASAIVYRVYRAAAGAGQSYSAPLAATAAGALGYNALRRSAVEPGAG